MLSTRDLKTYVIVLLVCALAVGLRLTLSYFSLVHVPPSSDEAIAIFLAESISRGESYPLLFTGQPYQFPVEAYVMSPIVDYFPHGSLGARFKTLLLGLVATLVFLGVAYRVFVVGMRWPTMLLIAFPSAYWLIQQSAYAAPQYAISAVFAALLFLLAVWISEKRFSAALLSFLAGAIAGLALSNHLLLASVVIAVFIVIVFSGHRAHAPVRASVFCLGFVLGFIPFILAIITIPGAYDGVAPAASLPSAVNRFFNLVLTRALPGAMGVNPPYFGDFLLRVDWGQPINTVYVVGFCIFFVTVVLLRVRSVTTDSKNARWPIFSWPDIFVLTTVLALVFMAMNVRGAAHDHRYLMPVVWSFPFLVGYVYSLRPAPLRPFVGAVAGLLAAFNIAVSVAVIDQWRRPDMWYYADIPPIANLSAFLQQQEIRYCYASFWLAYRITYETDGQIVCAPVFNERFVGWPLPPVKNLVDQQHKVAFVLSNSVGAKFRSKHFKTIMRDYGVDYDGRRFGQLEVYHDFNYPPAEGERNLVLHQSSLASEPGDVDGAVLADGDVERVWKLSEQQKSGQWVEIDLGGVSVVQRVTLHYPHKQAPPPRFLDISGRKENEWINLASRVPYRPDRMLYVHGHPIVGGVHQTIRFSAQPLDRIRIEIVEPSGDHPWALSEIEVGARKPG